MQLQLLTLKDVRFLEIPDGKTEVDLACFFLLQIEV